MKLRLFATVAAMALALSFTLVSNEASAAKRFGGGKSAGMQRQSVAPTPAPAATTPGSTLAPVNRPPVTTASAPTITRATVPPAASAQPATLPSEGTR